MTGAPGDAGADAPAVLVTRPLAPPDVMAELAAEFRLYRLWEAADPEALLGEVAGEVTALVTTGGFGASAALIDALPRLALIACYGVGVDAIDLAAARRRGIAVTNTPDVLTEDVADMAVALWLALGREVVRSDRWVRAGRWPREGSPPLARTLRGRRVGFLGFGRIGREIARCLAPYAVTVRYHQRRPLPEPEPEYVPDVVELARRSDDLFVCCTGGPSTRHLVDRAVLEALGSEGRLVNIARGSVVDEAALVAALADGRLGGAALDVFSAEPQVPEALLAMEQVVLTPHVGSATRETRLVMGRLVRDNLRAHFRGAPLPSPVRPE